MAQSFLGQKRLRKYYGKIREVLEMPNLIEVQKSSYELFLSSGDQPIPMDLTPRSLFSLSAAPP